MNVSLKILLTTLNKLFEIVIWARLEPWWTSNDIISENQGACKKGMSCLHSCLTLQEAVATSREANKTVFVAYFDVAKAFDSIWINGLFYQLYNLGITGRNWRILKLVYTDFKCKVHIQGKMSNWYTMNCGIHQGGYLSLLKYVAFINSLLANLKNSDLCINIEGVKCTPVGYADDMSAATTSKYKMDRVMKMVNMGIDGGTSTMLVRVLFLCMGKTGKSGIKIPDTEISQLVMQK